MFNTLTSSTLEYITQKTSLVPQEEVLIETFNCYKYFSVCQDVTLWATMAICDMNLNPTEVVLEMNSEYY
jgi:hypothetical protein